jgi:hypothetical protein
MTHTRAWKNFKRMEDSVCLFAGLIYLAAVLHAFRVLPGGFGLKATVTLAAPAVFGALSALLPLFVQPLRRAMRRYVWTSFRAGFGQTPLSVLSGLALPAILAGLIFLQIRGATHGGRYPAGIFSAYAAGIGILLAQALLVRDLERDPENRPTIEE